LGDNRTAYAIIAADLEREGPTWLFTAQGEVKTGGLAGIATAYGIMATG
jgi:stress response protein SCP2